MSDGLMQRKNNKRVLLIFLVSLISLWVVAGSISSVNKNIPINANDTSGAVSVNLGPPASTYLWPIQPNPSITGIIFLNWSPVVGAEEYYIYRDTQNIVSVAGLTPIGKTDSQDHTNFTDTVTKNREYYYFITPGNTFGNSTSNCQNVTVKIPLNKPYLQPISPSPDTDGIIELSWTSVQNAEYYYIFRHPLNISSISGLIPIGVSPTCNYTDTISIIGMYFYVIVASDGWVNSSISNCEKVSVESSTDIPGFELITAMTGLVGVIIFYLRRKKLQKLL
ncbi:MAG: hypothetical protein JSV09_11650 [Thermoplasmata archaeon]|nr:MAG: hypothetical protein JSV09_11650 [Thermoplasmata archaeon]